MKAMLNALLNCLRSLRNRYGIETATATNWNDSCGGCGKLRYLHEASPPQIDCKSFVGKQRAFRIGVNGRLVETRRDD